MCVLIYSVLMRVNNSLFISTAAAYDCYEQLIFRASGHNVFVQTGSFSGFYKDCIIKLGVNYSYYINEYVVKSKTYADLNNNCMYRFTYYIIYFLTVISLC